MGGISVGGSRGCDGRRSNGSFSSSQNWREAGTLQLKDDKSGNFSYGWNVLKGGESGK